ncbi:PQQ-dependent sugar dehydrogenase [Ulvibacterium sp.]|uniref:PQQ-dependent sugar dehydrogenase n=1 Tax=Ulvibacterium sp. TaxID=2665914 RepID=UPI0026350C81|nr:PQQ-dependent sugar dehydrogenase [Ulvibacterium sp.]
MGRGLIFSVVSCCAMLILACSTSSEPRWNGKNYLAHVKLDSSMLLVTEVAQNLEVPWDLVPGPDGWLYFTEQKGTINRVDIETGEIQNLAILDDLFYRKSSGLFSMALHPNFDIHPLVYIHYAVAEKDSNFLDLISSKVVQYALEGDSLINPKVILKNIPGNTYHNGSRMLIFEDKLWIGTGDAGDTRTVQEIGTLNGKVLRIHLDGSIPDDNPYPNNPVWSTGHRNIQGITVGNGKLYASEHGPNNDDEVNLIQKGSNYGWPDVHGFIDLENETAYSKDSVTQEPLMAWTPTIATAGLEYYNHDQIPEWKNSLLLTTLKGRSFRVLSLNEEGDEISKEHLFFQKFFGRLRDVAVGKEGEVYLATSNMDWHQGHQPWLYDSLPKSNGDRILKIQIANGGIQRQLATLEKPLLLQEEFVPISLSPEIAKSNTSDKDLDNGAKLYGTHCAACHAPDGKGNVGQIPPLVDSEWVSGNVARLIDVTLGGLNQPIEVNGVQYQGEMPAYKNLGDNEIRDILNYIRTEFGKTKGNIVAADIVHQRKGLK